MRCHSNEKKKWFDSTSNNSTMKMITPKKKKKLCKIRHTEDIIKKGGEKKNPME